MKKQFGKVICICLLFSYMFGNIAFAATSRGEGLSSVDEISLLLPVSQGTSTNKPGASTRGEALALSFLSISNEARGEIGVEAMTLLHKNVIWGMTTIYLDRWNEELQGWEFLEEYEVEFPNGNNEGETGSLDISFNITNQPSGHYYRLRGLHEIEFINDNNRPMWEGHTTCTDGVFITKTP